MTDVTVNEKEVSFQSDYNKLAIIYVSCEMLWMTALPNLSTRFRRKVPTLTLNITLSGVRFP